jgi:hypothetical protein
MFTNGSSGTRTITIPASVSNPVELNANRPVVITPDIQRFASPQTARREDVTVPLAQIKMSRQATMPVDPERLAEAGKAAVELSMISQMPLKDRSPSLNERVAGLQALLRITPFASREEFLQYQLIAQNNFTSLRPEPPGAAISRAIRG